MDSLAVLDFGSQYAQLIARRVREAHVYCELFPWYEAEEKVLAVNPRGFILSGGPASIYDPGAPLLPAYVLESHKPILGICYGMQALTHALGGMVSPSEKREYGLAELETVQANPLLEVGSQNVWMSHGDRIERPPDGFITLAHTANSPFAAIGSVEKGYYGVQFHPEVRHTQSGSEILWRFAHEICQAVPEWTPESIIKQAIQQIQSQTGGERVMSAVSGGVDSSVATTLVQRAVGEQLAAVFVNNGLLRLGEAARVVKVFHDVMGVELVTVEATDDFLHALRGVTDAEKKRHIIGEKFIRIFEAQALKLGSPHFLVQGTIYPDVVESSGSDRSQAARIKSHHNVGGLPESVPFELVEPLRYLFKDEVRHVGEALGLPHDLTWRQPFPGPGLAVRCLGEVTTERLERLRQADDIFTAELEAAGYLQMVEGEGTAQSFAVLLPVRSVGVMGDSRTYQEAVALRAVTTDDFMTADWARLPYDLLSRAANRIVNEVSGVNRVVYDITSKPPATIEWE
jgi:GMP synthase (glutamine-hydrolysing)